ncbi:MAG TPA: HNH endonuclease signature motif containing protein [Ktedonobacterales bacterium]
MTPARLPIWRRLGVTISCVIIVAVALTGCATATDTGSGSAGSHQFGVQTKTSGCQVNGKLPDSGCTPGAIFASATVDQICQSGYASSVRNVPTSEKDAVYAEYGIASHYAGEYEVDHLVSLELGGSNDISNLWPEAANPTPGFHQKDQAENYLHNKVCAGSVSLQQAQIEIATDWTKIYDQMQSGG